MKQPTTQMIQVNMAMNLLLFALFSLALSTSRALERCYYDIPQGNKCPMSDMLPNDVTLVYPGGDTRCFYQNATFPNVYFFSVQRGSGNDENNVLMFFQGGGFCYGSGDAACLPFVRFGSAIGVPRNFKRGIFDVRNDNNPFRDWTKVQVTYCTGDAHVGNAILETELGDVHYNGRNNVKSVISWVFSNIPSPDRVVLGGCSAGAEGLMWWSNPLVTYYQSLPQPPITSVVFDSWVGTLSTNSNGSSNELFTMGVQEWDRCSAVDFGWTLEQEARCRNMDWNVTDAQLATQAKHRAVPFSWISFKNDEVQRLYFCNSQPCLQSYHYDYTKRLLLNYALASNTSADNNLLSYFISDTGHCTLQRPHLNTYTSGEKNFTLVQFLASIATRTPMSTIHSSCRPSTNTIDNFELGYDFGCSRKLTSTKLNSYA